MTGQHPPSQGAGEAERFSSLGQVAGELLHDLANLVGVLDGRVRLALGDARAGRMPVGELERAVEGCGDLGGMLRDVLETLRGESVSPEVVMEPQAVTERAIRRALEGCHPVEVRLASTLPPGTVVRGRASFLYRTVANLLTNAARHAASEIRVTLETVEDGTRVRLSVEDDGPGIAPEERERVFRPLVTGAAGGTGLGLSSVAWTVAQLGGAVRCTASTALGGACFEVLLPAAAPLSAPAPPPRSFTGRRVLVVDDNTDLRRALERLLRRVGAEVVEVGGGPDPGEQVLHAVIRARPEAVLLDLDLGVRSGMDVWTLLREHFPHLARRVVFLSGLGHGDPLYEAARRTGQRVVAKPFDFDELVSALEAVLGEA